ncbi:MAG: DUF6125 family protein [Candidatus Heimdallarchaeota archaeon]
MKPISINDKLFFFERNFFTLDGLWMIQTEEETSWEIALSIDLSVWKRLLKIVFQRLKKYLNIKSNHLIDLIRILTFRWSVEGWNYEIFLTNQSQVQIIIKSCPYYATMYRNPDRHQKIPLICNNVCIPLYESIVLEFNNSFRISRSHFKGLGDNDCNFVFSENGISISKKSFAKVLEKKVDKYGKLFYFEKNFRTLDGLWIIEVENQINFDTALKLDIKVWQELYEIIFRRVIKYLDIKSRSLQDLIYILSFIWNCEGNYHKIIKKNEREVIININKCPYLDAMQRNPERHDYIASICKEMCIPYLEPVIKNFNPKIKLKRTKFIGIGNDICDFHFKLEK